MIKQGTISTTFGCHSIVHSILVLISWIRLYKRFPKFWQLVCIFIHDIGHLGRNYLDNYDEKKDHWILGAKIAGALFGKKGYELVAGHCRYSGLKESLLRKPDKYSWYIAPIWWLYWNNIVEPQLRVGLTNSEAVTDFKYQVTRSVESGEYKSTHGMFLERRKQRKREETERRNENNM